MAQLKTTSVVIVNVVQQFRDGGTAEVSQLNVVIFAHISFASDSMNGVVVGWGNSTCSFVAGSAPLLQKKLMKQSSEEI